MKKLRIITGIVFVLALAFLGKGLVNAASSLQFSPSTKTVTKDSQFTVSINIQADQAAYAADAVVLYTAADLDVVSATNGNFFDTFNNANDPANGRIELHGYFLNSTADAKTGSGTFATVTFKAKRGSGTGTVSFSCTAGGTETEILTPQGTNILNCSSLNTLTVTYTGTPPSAPPTVTPTPQVGGPQPTATPTPQPGVNSEPSCTGVSSLPTSNATTFSTITIWCQGTDPDGNLNGAQFDFGDGNQRIITGSPSDGKISTTYKYAKAGTYGISCKVRDSAGAWSSIPEICKSKVTITQGITGTDGISALLPTPTTKPVTGVPTPTPTIPQIVMADYVSPTPYVSEEKSVDETSETAEENPLQRILLYAGGGIIIVSILLFLVKKLTGGGPPANPPVIMPPTV